MACIINLTAVPGRKTPFGITLEIMGKSIAKKTIEVVSTVADVKSAVADFGRQVHQDHPDDSFYVSVSIATGSRKPNGFDAAHTRRELGQTAYMKMEGAEPSVAVT